MDMTHKREREKCRKQERTCLLQKKAGGKKRLIRLNECFY